jgi:hypothetical protein
MLSDDPSGADMADHSPELPPIPPTAESGPVIDPSSAAVPAEPRPTTPAPPSATSTPWYPDFERPSAAAAARPAINPASARPRRSPADSRFRTRAIVGGTSVAAFLAVLAGVAVHGHAPPASNVSVDNGATSGVDPNFTPPGVGGGFGSAQDQFGSSDPFSRRFSGGGFSASPGTPGGSAQTRSHGS